MLFDEKTITLKNGQHAIFRSPAVADAAMMLDYIKTASGETDFLTRYPEEWDGTDIKKEEAWINDMRESQNALGITCYVGGHVAGNCEIRFHSGIKTRHRATIGIAILREYWNLGIGSAMFEEMIAAAKAHGTEIMELEFLEGNDRARHLYEKVGFRVVSEKPNAFKLKDGTMCKEYYMQKYLE
ncbi:MAG: GNAT family N-acetyltransferase [Clostridia bacterium]|nr:GNAT family N-acetyltransferase [Clostridia bacterium]